MQPYSRSLITRSGGSRKKIFGGLAPHHLGSGVGPTFYIIMKSDLKTVSDYNVMCKYADDIYVLVPEHTDTHLSVEFNHIRQ